jgi:hypothetical protein
MESAISNCCHFPVPQGNCEDQMSDGKIIAAVSIPAVVLLLVGIIIVTSAHHANPTPPDAQADVAPAAKLGVNATITHPAVALVAAVQHPEPKEFEFELELTHFGSAWSLIALGASEQKYQPILREAAVANPESYLDKDDKFTLDVYKTHSKAVCDIVNNAALFSNALGFFKDAGILKLARDEKGDICGMVTTLVLSTEYNTLRTTERTRATEIFRTNIEKPMTYIYREMRDIGAKRVAVGITYGTRDFSGPDYDHKGETLMWLRMLTTFNSSLSER